MKRACLLTTTALILPGFQISCSSPEAGDWKSLAQSGTVPQTRLYTAYNLWFENPKRLFGINYKCGTMIPAGNEVSLRQVEHHGRRPTIKFITTRDGSKYTIHVRKQYFPSLTMEDIKNRLFTTKPFEELTKGLTDQEIESIKEGKLVEGMSKRAVLIARGYPPSHKTPSLEDSTWTYWDTRFVTRDIHFDENGRTRRDPTDDGL